MYLAAWDGQAMQVRLGQYIWDDVLLSLFAWTKPFSEGLERLAGEPVGASGSQWLAEFCRALSLNMSGGLARAIP